MFGSPAELWVVHAVQGTVKADQPGGRPVVQSHVLREKPDTPSSRRMAEAVSQHLAGSAGGEHQPHGNVDGGGLAGAVGTQKTENFTRFDPQGESIQGLDPFFPEETSIFLADVVELERGCCSHRYTKDKRPWGPELRPG